MTLYPSNKKFLVSNKKMGLSVYAYYNIVSLVKYLKENVAVPLNHFFQTLGPARQFFPSKMLQGWSCLNIAMQKVEKLKVDK